MALNDIPVGRRVVLYGAGQAGVNFLELLRKFRPDLTIRCFIDTFKDGHIEGISIKRPENFHARRSGDMVLITSMKWREIETLLLSRDMRNYLVVPPRFLVPSALRKMTANGAMDPAENPLSHELFSDSDREVFREQLDAAEGMLSFPGDRWLFGVLTGRVERGRSRVEAVSEFYYRGVSNRQYFDFIRYEFIKNIIEGGVANGMDTLEFLNRIETGGMVYGFEPNYETYLESPFREHLERSVSVRIFPRGLWSVADRLCFERDGLSSEIVPHAVPGDGNDAGDSMDLIDVVSIDAFVEEEKIERIDFIKMDIEGAELEALKGAVHTLKGSRPQLAICIYHKKEHFFEIPLFLSGILDNYEYRLGHYTAGTLETVWYGIPKELNEF